MLVGVVFVTTGCTHEKEEIAQFCAMNDGNWVADHNECEFIPQDTCEHAGGEFHECGSACRHQTAEDAKVRACTLQCVHVCKFSKEESIEKIPETEKSTTISTEQLIVLEENTDNLTLKVEYPKTGNAGLDELIKNFVMNWVNKFKETIGEEVISENWKNGFYITFEPFTYNEDIRTYKFKIVEFTGGAHDNMYFKTFTYDFANNKEIAFREMFQEEHNPLNTIVPLSQAQLTQTLGDSQMLLNGTAEEFKNYAHFAPTAEELLIFFPPYQVAPWAAGPQTVKLKWEDINVVLKLPFFLGNE